MEYDALSVLKLYRDSIVIRLKEKNSWGKDQAQSMVEHEFTTMLELMLKREGR